MTISQSLVCVTPSPARLLTTVDRLKTRFEDAYQSPDATLVQHIEVASAKAIAHVNWPVALGEVCAFGHQEYTETFLMGGKSLDTLYLARPMISEVTEVTIDGTVVDLSTLFTNRMGGYLKFLDGRRFSGRQIVVSYGAGWALPSYTDEQSVYLPSATPDQPVDLQKLPVTIEEAVIRILQTNRILAGDDAFEAPLKSESLTGLGVMQYAVADIEMSPSGIPADAASLLDQWRVHRL